MILFFVLIVVVLIGLTTAAVMGLIGGFMADPTSSQSFTGLPGGELSADSLAHVHFDQALRGYRMNQVDEVIDALGARVRALEAEAEAEAEAEVAARSLIHAEPPAAGDPTAAGTGEVNTDRVNTDIQER